MFNCSLAAPFNSRIEAVTVTTTRSHSAQCQMIFLPHLRSSFREVRDDDFPNVPPLKRHSDTSIENLWFQGKTDFFFLVSWGGVRMSPIGTSATNWAMVPAPDER
jgi:hypothetical protein